MHFVIEKKALLRPLQLAVSATEKKQVEPVLSNVLLEATDKLQITGTDLEMEIKTFIKEVKVVASGVVTVPAKKLVDICKVLPEDSEITVKKQGEKVFISSGKSKFSLVCLKATEFPVIGKKTELGSTTVNAQEIKRLINKTSFAMAQQDVRYFLNGLLIDFSKDALRVVATDGHRLATAVMPIAQEVAQQVILPRKAVLELVKVLDMATSPIDLSWGKNYFCVRLEGCQFTSKLIEGKFPNYTRVLPTGEAKVATLNKEELKDLLLRVSALLSDKNKGASLLFKQNKLAVKATSADLDEVEEELEIEYNFSEIEMGFNVAYILEYLNVIDAQELNIELTGPNGSALLSKAGEKDSMYVVMPMKL